MPEKSGSAHPDNGKRYRHASSIKKRLTGTIEKLRTEVERVADPQARALLEVSAEVIGGLVKSFTDYERGSEKAWTGSGDGRRSNQPAMDWPKRGNDLDPSQLPQEETITLKINGEQKTLTVAPWVTLLDLLRENLDLTGTKKGCDHGQCGACTVLVDGRRINSCLTLAVMKDHSEVITIEGLAEDGKLHPVQQAFIEHDAFQCGYCTPGQICSAVGLLQEGKARTADEIRELMSGNLCRCGAYPNIVAAVEQVIAANGRSDLK